MVDINLCDVQAAFDVLVEEDENKKKEDGKRKKDLKIGRLGDNKFAEVETCGGLCGEVKHRYIARR